MSARGHELAREIIARHGRDRYPTPELTGLKLAAEVGELASEILRGRDRPAEPVLTAESLAKIRKEYGDVGLTLHALGNQLGLDLDEEMAKVVARETRSFVLWRCSGP